MIASSLFLQTYCPALLLTLMALSSILLPPHETWTRIAIPVAGVAGCIALWEGGATAAPLWLLLNLLFSCAVLLLFACVACFDATRCVRPTEERISLAFSRSPLDHLAFLVLTSLYSLFIVVWFLV